MGWRETFALVGAATSRQSYRPQTFQTFEQRFSPTRRTFGVRQTPGRTTWADLSSGRMAGASRAPTTAPGGMRSSAGFPQRVNVSLPYSSTGPRSPYAPTPVEPLSDKDDPSNPLPYELERLAGSFGQSVGQTFSNLNLANFIPFFMERVNVLANDLADSDIPGVSDVARPIGAGTDLFIDGVTELMRPIGQFAALFPDWVRDSQLGDRAKLYRAISKGEAADFGFGPVSDPLATLGHIAGLIQPTGIGWSRARMGLPISPVSELVGSTVSEEAWQANHWRNIVLNAVDPQQRLHAEQRLAILRDSLDLPESVKQNLDRNPNADDDRIKQWLDEAPEGKQWSYAPGAKGIIKNVGNPLLFFLAEARAGYGVGRGLGAAGEAAGGVLGTGVRFGGRAISTTARLQTAAVATGVGITATTTMMGAIARYAGNEEAIAWFDNANRSTEFSDDPYVQLATGFSVNPLAAGRMLKKGVLVGKHGLFEVPLDKITGQRLKRFYDSQTTIADMTRRMFKLGSLEEAELFLDEQGLRSTQADRIMQAALDVVLDRLPRVERVAWNAIHADPVERSAATLKRYGRQALDLIERDPELVAERFHTYDWNYRMMPGPFEPEVAAKIALDHRHAVEMTYDLRQKQNLVVGYREFLNPKGQALARERVAQAVDEQGMVPMRVLQDLVADFPALRKEWGGLVRSSDALIPRATIEQIIDNAHITWSNATKRNPVKAATGMDPILRPSSPTRQRDFAEAVGTNVDTIAAIEKADTSAAAVALYRQFLKDKGVMDEARLDALTPEEAWSAAGAYLDDVTGPWWEMGKRLDAAEAQMDRLRGELVRIKREGGSVESDRTIRVQREINEIADLVRQAGDPIRTFASATPRTAGTMDVHLADLAARKVDAMERLRVIASVDDDLKVAELSEKDLARVVTGPDGELADVYELLGAPPPAVLDTYLEFRTANMYVNRNLSREQAGQRGILSSRRQNVRELSNKGQELVRDTEAAPGSYQWAQILASPGFVRRMRERADEVFGRRIEGFGTDARVIEEGMTGAQIADLIESAGLARGVSGKPIDDIAKAWETDREGALRRLSELRRAREDALEGRTPASVRRTAAITVSDDYVKQAEADRAARELVYDAEYDAFWHPRNIAKVLEITNNPDELWPSLREVADTDPAIREGLARVAAATGRVFTRDRDAMGEFLGHPGITSKELRDLAVEGPFVYHATPVDRLPAILKSGLQPGRVREGEEVGVYFAPTGATLAGLIPSTHNNNLVLLRVRRELVTESAKSVEAGGNIEYVSLEGIRPGDIEVVGADGNWRSLPHGDTSLDAVYADPSLAAAVKAELVPADFEAPIEGRIREWTDLDYLITSGDAAAIRELSEQFAASRTQPRPPTTVSESVAKSLAQMPRKARSYQYRRQLSDLSADFKASPSERILNDPANKVGVEVLSVLNHGITGTKPATLQGVIALLKDIENGSATRMGVGPELQAEAQRVARALLDDAVRQARKDPDVAGTFSAGFFPEDEQALAASLDDLLKYDESDPLGTLQYGLKKAPKDAVVMEWSKVPGLAEELLSGRFQPWEERVLTAKAREAFNFVFGRHSNVTIRQQVRNRFMERATKYGVSQSTADAIWERWAQIAHDSRRPSLRKTKTGIRRYESGDNPLYADVWNIPNEMLDSAVHGIEGKAGVLDELSDVRRQGGAIPAAERAAAEKVDWADVFREASSFTRRQLSDRLGKSIGDAYGLVAHNRAVTTLYYLFRFGLDVRYHAMNYLEAQILYAGRAGLRKGEIDEGLLGMSEGYLRKLDLDPTSNTGYQFSRDRMAWAYRTFLKEQPDALRTGIRSIIKEGPEGQALMERAMRELADADPQLRDMVQAMGDTPEKYLKELDAWHNRMLNSIDEATDARTIDEALAKEMADSPALAELFDRLGQVNRDLWSDIRATFYGNPNRSRAERVLNSYLLFWPLSYQIKSTKWFAKVLFDRVGGLQTNALGAVTLDRIADTHNRLLATDPEYKDWFEKHDTLVFVAGMLFPVSFDEMGVSLNPALRGAFFGGDVLRALEIGPVYTAKLLQRIRDEFEVDMYPTVGDFQRRES